MPSSPPSSSSPPEEKKKKEEAPVLIRIRDLVKEYGSRRVLDGVSVDVRKGEALVVMGGSGCGKSTLLRHMIGAEMPTSGDVELFGEDFVAANENQRNAIRRKFGMLFQSGALLQSMTVAENVALPLESHTGLGRDIIDLTVKMKLDQVGLTSHGDKLPSEISGGMRKRVALARALALDPELLFSDEPTAGLDPVMTAIIDELTNTLTKKIGATVVVVTHDMPSAFRIATRMIMLGTGDMQGKVVIDGTPEEVRNTDNPIVRQFIEGKLDGPATEAMRGDGYREALLTG
ncbi:MAG: ABC transporter ATP-binding protein [Verrucomicrobiota bacterium]